MAPSPAWNWLLDYLAFKSKALRRFVNPARLLLIRDGTLQPRNLRRLFLTTEDVSALLRQQGIESVTEVKRANLESDGEVSIIKFPAGSRATESPPHSKDQRPIT